MKSKDFYQMRDDIQSHALSAQQFAVQLDTDPNTEVSARAWYALADRLFEALDQMDDMTKVIIPTKA